jgi:menaquinone-dependent protoporphyrinogen IX oxidase
MPCPTNIFTLNILTAFAVEFVKKNQSQLSQMPTAFFTVHLLHLDDSAESRALRAGYTEPVRKIVAPGTEMFFAGRIGYAKLSLFERLISSMMKAPEQDLRDWNKIRAWAESVYPTLPTA